MILFSIVFPIAASARPDCTDVHFLESTAPERSRFISVFRDIEIERDESGGSQRYTIHQRDRPVFQNIGSYFLLDSSKIDRPLQKELWNFGNQQYQFVNVGFKNLEASSDMLNRLIADHVINSPGLSLEIEYSSDRIEREKKLSKIRWTIHSAVLKKYFQVKGYLEPEDVLLLKIPNIWSSNNDVLALMSQSIDYDRATTREIEKNLLMTSQISYYGDHNFFRPTFRGMMKAKRFSMPFRNDKLPFEYRLDPAFATEFRRKFYQDFDAKRTCEFVRHVRFDENLPPEVRDSFLFEGFRLAIRRGMRFGIASADEKTARLFRLYGFEVYAPLPTRQKKMPEYLLAVDFTSKKFQKFFRKLAAYESNIQREHQEGGW